MVLRPPRQKPRGGTALPIASALARIGSPATRISGYQHIVCRAPQPHDPHGNPPLYPLTNAFTKKVENHCHALALYFLFYNFVVKQHKSLKGLSPAMAAGVSDRLWSVEDFVVLIDEHAERNAPRLARKIHQAT